MARILIIEDNAENLELMSYLLTAFGHTPLSASDGDQGIAMARREAPDLIVCDIHLPGSDGYAVAQTLKSDAQLRCIPLVAVTALAMVGDREKGLSAGFDGYLSKPIDPQKFVAQVEVWLGPDKHGAAPAPHRMTNATEPQRSTGTTAKILVVDDSQVNRELIRATLSPFGYEVWLASSAAEGLALARQQAPDMILSDVHMPGKDGFDFIRSIKQEPTLAALPFLFISSTVQFVRSMGESDRLQALKLGIDRFLLRPIEPQQLLEQVAACLASRGASDDGDNPGR